jgi:hypothetical protein
MIVIERRRDAPSRSAFGQKKTATTLTQAKQKARSDTTKRLAATVLRQNMKSGLIALLTLDVTAAFSPVTKADGDEERHHRPPPSKPLRS